VPQVQVSFDIDANGLLQVSATDRTTGRQQSVSIQGGSNLSEEEIGKLIEEAEQKASEDRRRKAEIDRRNRAQTLVAQAERRLRDAALELGPYGAERQQRAVEIAMRDVQDLLAGGDLGDLDLGVSQLQEALYGLNRRLASERKQESNPLQGLKNTLGSIKDELFADDDWDDWDRGRSRDPWAEPSWSAARGSSGSWERDSWERSGAAPGWEPPPVSRWEREQDSRSRFAEPSEPRWLREEEDQPPSRREPSWERELSNSRRERAPLTDPGYAAPPAAGRSAATNDDPWAED